MVNLAKLRWQCRRGTLELDLLLTRYFDSCYLMADAGEQAQFVELLGFEDDVLIKLLLCDSPPQHDALNPLIQKIRIL